ncbi:MAG: phenylacetate--CoA ligase family protein, partial [Candidatus Helarchaeota archaeon]
RPVRKYYNEVKNCYIHGTSTENTQTKIRQLINHAVKTTEFYKSFDKDIALNQLPVVNKVLYKENYDKFISSQYKNAKSNRIVSTSGSTGIPFSIVQNKNKIHHNTAASIFLCSLGRYFIGMKQAFIRVWAERNQKSRFRCLLENVNMLDTAYIDNSGIETIIEQLNHKNYKSILSYASSLAAINQYLNEYPTDKKYSVQSIISQSEALPEIIRHELEEKFSCVVNSVYSNQENGIMGIQDKDGVEYYLDTSSYFFEFLRLDSDAPVGDGELGRIVVTDLYNYAFPILRYDTGDLVKYQKIDRIDSYRLIIKELFGRRVDTIFDCNGKALSPAAVARKIANLDGIKQWQIIQIDQRKYQLNINLASNSFNDREVHKHMLAFLGENAKLEIQYTDEIPVLNSGKRRTIINEYNEIAERVDDLT